VNIFWIVDLVASDFDLLESPSGQDRIRGSQITIQQLVLESHSRSERVYPSVMSILAGMGIIHNLDHPKIIVVPYRLISVAGHFMVFFRNGCSDGVRVQVSASGLMD
jgi:hypothetical protein